jgi:hypothetical protein
MDDMLGSLEEDTTQSLENLTSIFGNLHTTLRDYVETIRRNRAELLPQNEEASAAGNDADGAEDFVNTDMMRD